MMAEWAEIRCGGFSDDLLLPSLAHCLDSVCVISAVRFEVSPSSRLMIVVKQRAIMRRNLIL
jgi:hypothetical protein